MVAAVAGAPAPKLIRLRYLWYSGAALAVLIAAILSGDIWLLNYVHVMAGVLWTGIDLFMGFVLGPILRTADPEIRKAIALRLTPRTLFIMPTLTIMTTTAGWFLADARGYLDVPWPQYGWIAATLAIVTLMSIQGLGYLRPTNLRVCFELQKAQPDYAKIGRLMSSYYVAVALQGAMQVIIIVIMARFVTGI